MDTLFNEEVYNAIVTDQRTTNDGNMNPLGYPHGIIQPNVLQNGRGNFSKAYNHSKYGRLSPDDRTLLYCFMNFRGHFHTTKANFALRKHWLLTEFVEQNPIMIDISCGPATSALALAELYPGTRFTYIGVDSAHSMRTRGASLLTSAKSRGVVHESSIVSFESSWNSLGVTFPTNSAVMFNFAFFFASKTLRHRDLNSLASKVERIGTRLPTRSLIISYTNSIQTVANENYERFLDILQVTPKFGRANRTVRFRNRRHHTGAPATQEFSRELYGMEF